MQIEANKRPMWAYPDWLAGSFGLLAVVSLEFSPPMPKSETMKPTLETPDQSLPGCRLGCSARALPTHRSLPQASGHAAPALRRVGSWAGTRLIRHASGS